MTKSELIDAVAARRNLPRATVEKIVDLVFDQMVDALKAGDRIELRGFGAFTVRTYEAYKGRNPRTGTIVEVAAKRLPYFKVGKDLAERVNDGGDPPSSPLRSEA
jgi:integration host factor subunit beta